MELKELANVLLEIGNLETDTFMIYYNGYEYEYEKIDGAIYNWSNLKKSDKFVVKEGYTFIGIMGDNEYKPNILEITDNLNGLRKHHYSSCKMLNAFNY